MSDKDLAAVLETIENQIAYIHDAKQRSDAHSKGKHEGAYPFALGLMQGAAEGAAAEIGRCVNTLRGLLRIYRTGGTK